MTENTESFDAVMVGLYMMHKRRELGLRAQVFEASGHRGVERS
jgi:hypothetical protein